MSYGRVREALGASNVPGYTLLSGGVCYNPTIKQSADAKVFCEGDLAAGKTSSSSSPSAWDKLFGGLTAVAQVRGSGQQPAVIGGMPSWLLPVGVGVVAIGAVLLLTKKKAPAAAPTSNPGRRRRRR